MHETPPTIAETYTGKSPETPKRPPNWKALLFVVFFFAAVLVAGFLQSPLSAVSRITVSGNHQIRYEDILKTADIEKGMSFWKISSSQAEDAITGTFPLIASADVSVSWTGEVVIAVVEKTVSGLLMTGDQFCTILHDGTVQSCAQMPENEYVPLISMDNPPAVQPGQPVQSADLLELVKQIPEVGRTVQGNISEIHITAEGPWRVYMRDKFEVRIPPRQFADKLKDYDQFKSRLGDKPPGIINLQESMFYKSYEAAKQEEAQMANQKTDDEAKSAETKPEQKNEDTTQTDANRGGE